MPNALTASASCQASSQQPAPAAHPVSDLRDERRPRGTPPQRAAEKGKGFADGRPRYMVAACTMYDDVLSNRRRRRRRRTPHAADADADADTDAVVARRLFHLPE